MAESPTRCGLHGVGAVWGVVVDELRAPLRVVSGSDGDPVAAGVVTNGIADAGKVDGWLAAIRGLRGLDTRDAFGAPTNGFAIVAYSMMSRLGRTQSDYRVVEVGGVRERLDALADGRVDASLLAPPLDEIGRARGMTVAMRVGELTPAYPGLGVVVRRSLLESRLDEVAAYLRALDDANRWMREAPRGDTEPILEAAGLGPAAVASALASAPASLLPSHEGLEVLARLRDELSMAVPGAPDAADLVDLRPLQAAGLVPAP
jgi:ABC-type nitrate/sulfonate/bicarbonate transport system substrate-binding protein